MKHKLPDNSALIVVDVQQGMDEPRLGKRNNPEAEANIARLLEVWRQAERKVIHVHHSSVEPDSPLRPDLPGFACKPEAKPQEDEPVFIKSVNSAFIGTELEYYLRSNDLFFLVIVGLTTDHCISSTVRMAANLGFTPLLVQDATATFDRRGADGKLYSAEDIHAIHLASLHGEFCEVVDTESLIE